MAFKFTDTDRIIKVYNYSADCQEYIGDGDCFIAAGTGLPAWCTDITPPAEKKPGYALIWSDDAGWQFIEDHRGKTVYRTTGGDPLVIEKPGPLPEGITAIAPASPVSRWRDGQWVTDIADARAMKTAEINAWRDGQEAGRTLFSWKARQWDASRASIERLEPVLMAARAGALPPGFFWTDAANEDLPVTVDDLAALEAGMMQALVTHGFKIHQRQRQMKTELAAMTDTDAVLSYQPGWGA